MAIYQNTPPITFTSPATATTAISEAGALWTNLHEWDWFTLIGRLAGATGGALDVYLQSEIYDGVWVDWVHFKQVAAAAAAAYHSFDSMMAESATIVTGGGNDSTPGVALAAGKMAFAHPGKRIRVVSVAGAGTSAGAAQALYLTKWRNQ